MVILKNGRGQLGDALKEANLQCSQDVYIYHTWEVNDKHPKSQLESLERFKYFVDEHKHSRIIFISTTSENETQYVLAKHMAEAYLINNTSHGIVLRVPMFVGPRVISNFKDDSKKPYGTMELIHTRNVVEKINELLNYDGVKRFHTLHGEKISAQLIYDLVRI
jgi:hypothetical protein